jgi:SNF2-related domain/Helicase conserved C-terminal domain
MERRTNEDQGELDLSGPDQKWPEDRRFPHNFRRNTVKEHVWRDLTESVNPLLVTGYSSLEWIVDFLAALHGPTLDQKRVRILIGFEPRALASLSKPAGIRRAFPREVSDYWLERGISLERSSRVIRALEVLKSKRLLVRISGRQPIHAKIYVGDAAVTLGSSNFSSNGMLTQVEGNVRFEAEDQPRFGEAVRLAESIWTLGENFKRELEKLLTQLLSVVSWEDALGRATAEILEGRWARGWERGHASSEVAELWPSQRSGMAQAMWILGNVGSVLVADATGSGKTRMGAHLIRGLVDHNLRTGRARRDLPVMICPPAVQGMWEYEANDCGQALKVYSHGELSNAKAKRRDQGHAAVARAQILAIDEAHNFLNLHSRRSRALLGTLADHVVLYTATPINRGADDLVSIIDLLGADNFEDNVLDVVDQVVRRRRLSGARMSESEIRLIRDALSGFVVRRTKTDFNRMIDADPSAYLNALGHECRFPQHNALFYETGETQSDRRKAKEIRRLSTELRGLINLQSPIDLPDFLRNDGLTEEAMLRRRLASAPAIARWQVTSLLRSSRAALWEHVYGTHNAVEKFRIEEGFKSTETGNVVDRLSEMGGHPPEIMIKIDVPDWLRVPSAHRAACEQEAHIYSRIAALCDGISEKRTTTKARHLFKLWRKKGRVLGFDRSLISLFLIKRQLLEQGATELDIVVATGVANTKKRLSEHFQLGSSARPVIGLCSDALSEAVNLQEASALLHLDLPTVVRTLEQRIGRIDRMDSPHESIDAHWPANSPEFSLRSDDRLAARVQLVEDLLRSNIKMPTEDGSITELETSTPITTKALVKLLEKEQESEERLDALKDAFSEVRSLVEGDTALISPADYESVRDSKARVISAISVIESERRWCFLAVAGVADGMPQWVLVRDADPTVSVDLHQIPKELRGLLGDHATNRPLDEDAAEILDSCLNTLRANERALLPRKRVRALEEMEVVLLTYLKAAKRSKDDSRERLISGILAAVSLKRSDDVVDLRRMADWWLDLIRPVWREHFSSKSRRRVGRLQHLRKPLRAKPLSDRELSTAFEHVVEIPSLDRRVIAAIVGVPREMGAGVVDGRMA